MKQELENSAMYFRTAKGDEFVISKADIKVIAADLFVEMIHADATKIFMISDPELQRAKMLYEVIRDEGPSMNPEQKEKFLEAILESLTGNNFDLKTLADELDRKK